MTTSLHPWCEAMLERRGGPAGAGVVPERWWTPVGEITLPPFMRELLGRDWQERTFLLSNPERFLLGRRGRRVFVRFGLGDVLRWSWDPARDRVDRPFVEVGSAGPWQILLDATDPEPANPRVYAIDHEFERSIHEDLFDTGASLHVFLASLVPWIPFTGSELPGVPAPIAPEARLPGFACARLRFVPVQQPTDVDRAFPNDHHDRENLAASLECAVTASVDLGEAPFASWLLARLWRLCDGGLGMLIEPLVQDGAPWIVEAVVADSSGREQAFVHLVGWSWFTLIEVRGSEDGADLDAIEAALVDGLTAEPRGLAPCRIVVHDPETDGNEVFGWDGDRLLGKRRD